MTADEERRREALGIGLFALTALLLLALFSSGPAAAGGDNLIGPAGGLLDRWLTRAFGLGAALLLVGPVAWGVRCFGMASDRTAVRWSVLGTASAFLVPAVVWIARRAADAGPTEAAGWAGRSVGALLTAGFGTAGALIIAGAVLLVLLVLTVGWSPARGLARASRAASRAGSRALRETREMFAGSGGAAAAADAGEPAESEGGSPWERFGAGESEESDADGGEGGGLPFGDEDGEQEEPTGPVAAEDDARAGSLADPGDLTQTELPPLDLLTEPKRTGMGLSEQELRELGALLIDKLETFGVEGEISGWTTGPVVTQFEVKPAPGVKVGQISNLADDLALALKAPSVRIVAPIPGKGAVGVEVPNPEPDVVYLREVLESDAYRSSGATLPLALGRDLAGDPCTADLTRMPHLLIAGATGTGKSVCINSLITGLLYRFTPKQLRLLMIDPKMVELSVYEDLPHLRHPVVTDNEEAADVLKWAKFEMNRRYSLLSANAARNLDEFNQRVKSDRPVRGPDGEEYGQGELPYVVLVIDELADLIMTVQSQVESPLAMLAQKARAVGIHLIIATQRPSVNVITGLIKANFPSRIAFRVASKTDSRTILDQNGAESLLGNGDMLFLPPGESDAQRIQGSFLTSDDTERLVSWYQKKMEADREAGAAAPGERDILDMVEEKEAEEARVDVVEEVLEDRDELFRQAAEIVVNHDSGSTSLLQRRLQIGYGRAARIIDQLHHAGIVGPSRGSQAREVMVDTVADLDDVIEENLEEGVE